MSFLLRPAKHLATAYVVLAGAALGAFLVVIDLLGVNAIVAVDTTHVALLVVIATLVGAAGKLAEMSSRLEELTAEAATFSNAPVIDWTDPSVILHPDQSIGVYVYCENSGPSESVAVYVAFGSDTNRAGDDLNLVGRLVKWHPIKAHKLGDEHKFLIEMRSRPGLSAGEREISWWMVYTDRTRPEIAYLTRASFRARFAGIGAAEVADGTLFLDTSSTPKVRRQRYLDEVRGQRSAPERP